MQTMLSQEQLQKQTQLSLDLLSQQKPMAASQPDQLC